MNKNYLITNKKTFALFLVLVPVRAICAVAVTFVITSIIDAATNGEINRLPGCIILFLVYIFADLAVNILNAHLHFQLIQDSTIKLKRDLYHKICFLSKTRFQEKSSADYISVIETDVGVVKETYYTILDMIADFIRMAAAVGVVFWYNWKIAVFIIVTVFVQAFIPFFFDKKLVKAGEEYSQANERHMNVLKDGLGSFMTAKIFNIEECLEEIYSRAVKRSEMKWRNREFLQEYVKDISYVFNKIAYLGIFLLGGYLMIKGEVRLAVIVAVTNIVPYISGPSLYLVQDISQLKASKESFRKIDEILSQEEDHGGSMCVEATHPDLSVKDLSYCYGNNPVFENVNYTFENRKKYLIIGKSGGGKSTLLNLLAGLQTDYQGHVFLGNTEVRDIRRSCLTKQICVIEQEPYLFNDSVYNNITLYEDISKERVLQALDQVGLSDLLKQMDQGIDTSLSENADRVSGGEKQRIAIARALVRNTPILLLDESTSHLDAATTAGIEKLVLSLSEVTVILVSHNATETAEELANHILKMEDSRLQESI